MPIMGTSPRTEIFRIQAEIEEKTLNDSSSAQL
jgi:hypothetical protein